MYSNTIEQAEAEPTIEYMRSMRDAWEREAEALRKAMHMWADRAIEAEHHLEHMHTSASVIQAHTRRPAEGSAPATLTPLRKLEPVQEELMEKPFREVLRELHQMLIESKKSSPKETGQWWEKQVKEQARRIAQEAYEVVDEKYSNHTPKISGSESCMRLAHDLPCMDRSCFRCQQN